jgi:hypothetical protein
MSASLRLVAGRGLDRHHASDSGTAEADTATDDEEA